MAQGILDIFRQSNDANLGQTLIRLAKLAEARHRYESAFESDTSNDTVSSRKVERPTQGSTRAAEVRHITPHDVSAHTEVDR